jgi:hypothetical protein
MESNGKGGMIHLSPTTAERLIAAGKEKWLTKREDKVMAKGIGEMNTYWANVRSESMVSSGRDTSSVGGGPDAEDAVIDTSIAKPDRRHGNRGRSSGSGSSDQSGSSPAADINIDIERNSNSNRKREKRSSPPRSTVEHMLSME